MKYSPSVPHTLYSDLYSEDVGTCLGLNIAWDDPITYIVLQISMKQLSVVNTLCNINFMCFHTARLMLAWYTSNGTSFKCVYNSTTLTWLVPKWSTCLRCLNVCHLIQQSCLQEKLRWSIDEDFTANLLPLPSWHCDARV